MSYSFQSLNYIAVKRILRNHPTKSDRRSNYMIDEALLRKGRLYVTYRRFADDADFKLLAERPGKSGRSKFPFQYPELDPNSKRL